jgi:hypothetical protein
MKRHLIFEAGGKYNYHCALKGEDVGLIGGSQCDGYRDYSLLVVNPCSLVEIYRRTVLIPLTVVKTDVSEEGLTPLLPFSKKTAAVSSPEP